MSEQISTRREEFEQRKAERKRGTCRHFNGIQNEACRAGVVYHDAFGRGPGCFANIPCFPALRPDLPAKECAQVRHPTQEELDDDERQLREHMARMRTVLAGIREWRETPPRGKQAIVECPACKGRLHLSQSSYNGHVHGRCETDGCVNWME